MNMIFETQSLQNVTPAVLSRCGVILFEEQKSDWKFNMREFIIDLIEKEW